jgi:hypothetical protein
MYLIASDAAHGQIIFGGVDLSAIGPPGLVSVPMISAYNATGPAIAWTSLALTNATGQHAFPNFAASMSTTFWPGQDTISLPNEVAQSLYTLTGAGPVSRTVDCALLATRDNLTFGFAGPGGPTIQMPLSDLIFPTLDERGDLVSPFTCWLGVDNDTSGPYGAWLGSSFMRSAYIVFDNDNKLISIAPVARNVTESRMLSPMLQGIPAGSMNPFVSSTVAPSSTIVTTTSATASSSGTSSSVPHISTTSTVASLPLSSSASSSTGSTRSTASQTPLTSTTMSSPTPSSLTLSPSTTVSNQGVISMLPTQASASPVQPISQSGASARHSNRSTVLAVIAVLLLMC